MAVPHPQPLAAVTAAPTPDPINDVELVQRIARRDHAAFEALMRRHNSQLFRVARTILKDDGEAEDAVQDAYIDAYRHAGSFKGGAQVRTWLTRIVINQALMRLRKQRRERVVVPFAGDSERQEVDVVDERTESPSSAASRAELRRILERRIDDLPLNFRTVFVMREVDEMTTGEIAECLSIPEATVRTRVFRARALLRESLARDIDAATLHAFEFAGDRCDRIVAVSLERARLLDAAV
jgi:RNA polymerase sigma-70 factor, ECF subfamily